MRINFIDKGVKYYNLLKVQAKRITDPNFNSFLKFEKDQSIEKINSKSKLEYLKMIDLSKQGYINPERKQFFKKEKELYKLIDVDQNIKMIGKVSLSKGNALEKQIFVGFNSKTNKLFMSDSHMKQIPIWKKPSAKVIKELFSNVTPEINTTEENALNFSHKFFHDDVEALSDNVKRNLEKEFNNVADIALRSNKYINNAFPTLPNDLANNAEKYKNIHFKVPASFFPQHKAKSEFVIASIKNYDQSAYLFKPLVATDNKQLLKANRATVENSINSRSIQLLGKVNSKIAIGFDKQTGNSQIGVKLGDAGYQWKSYSEIQSNATLSEKEKHNLSLIVENKDFLIEKDKLIIGNKNDSNEHLIVKKHYSKPGLYFMETYKGEKPYALSNFQKLSEAKVGALATKYKNNPQIKELKNLAVKENVVKKETFKDLAKGASHAINR